MTLLMELQIIPNGQIVKLVLFTRVKNLPVQLKTVEEIFAKPVQEIREEQ